MNPQSLLYRAVHIAFVHRGNITIQVFQPMPGMGGLLNVFNGGHVSAKEAWHDFVRMVDSPLRYVGVVGVTVAECETLELIVKQHTGDRNHAYISFNNSTANQIRRKARALKEFAAFRGWLFRPE